MLQALEVSLERDYKIKSCLRPASECGSVIKVIRNFWVNFVDGSSEFRNSQKFLFLFPIACRVPAPFTLLLVRPRFPQLKALLMPYFYT